MPTNVSTSFFFINLLFQARRAGSNPRPSCILRCVAARDKSRPGRRAYGPRLSRGLRTCAAQCLGSQFAVRGRTGQVAPMAAGYGPRSSRGLCTFAAQCLGSQFAPRGPGPQWGPFRTDRAGRRDARCRSCSSKDIAHVRGVWLVGDWKRLAYFAVRGRAGQVAPMAAGYGPRLSRELRTCAAQCLGSQFAVCGRTGQIAPMAAGYGPRLSRGLRTSAAPCLGSQFAVRGRTGQVAPMAAGYGPRSSRGLRTCAWCGWSGIGRA